MSVRFGLLALLDEGPSHGYQLKADFEARTGGVWTVNVGQVYTTLDRLHADGLAVPDDDAGGGDRRPWRITPAGQRALDAWFAESAVAHTPPRDELLVKVLLALGRSVADALAVIDAQRTALYTLLQEQRRARRGHEPDLPARLMDEALASRREADARWLDLCEELARATAPDPRARRSPRSRPVPATTRKATS